MHRVVSTEVQRVLSDRGGLNLYGEPRFRLVWGRDRVVLIGGEWINYDDNGNQTGCVAELREWPKYHPFSDYWYVEKWVPPEFYGSRSRWEAQTYESTDGRRLPACGPYPERGDYELSWRVSVTRCPVHSDTQDCLPSCTCKQYFEALEPTIGMMEHYASILMRSEVASSYERMKAIERELEKEREAKEKVQKDIWDDKNLLLTGSYVAVPKNFDSALQEWITDKKCSNPKAS